MNIGSGRERRREPRCVTHRISRRVADGKVHFAETDWRVAERTSSLRRVQKKRIGDSLCGDRLVSRNDPT